MLMTLAKERRWRRGDDGADVIPIRWLGGKVNAGEGYEAAALREAEEEISVEVALRPAPVTYVGTRGSDVVSSERPDGIDGPAPLLVSLRENGVRSVSYAGALLGEPSVGDVPGLLWVPLEALPALAVGLPFSRFGPMGIELSSAVEIPDGAVARLGATGTEHLTRQVVDRYGAGALDAAVDRSPEPAIQLA
jgi:hypothetical protein